MRILIIEDETLAAKRIRKMIEELDSSIEIAGHTDSIETSVEWLKNNTHPDLILMDIELADGQSFEIFNRTEVHSTIIFTTAYDEYAIRAFKVNSIDYLLKPVNPEELANAIDKFRKLNITAPQPMNVNALISALKDTQPGGSHKNRFLVKQGQRFIPLEVTDIAYFYTEDKVSFIKTFNDQRYVVDHSLDDLEELVNPELFFRANRQFIVNSKSLEAIHNHFNGKLKIQLKPIAGEDVYVSRERAGDFRKWLGES